MHIIYRKKSTLNEVYRWILTGCVWTHTHALASKKRIRMRKTTQWCAIFGVKGSYCEVLRKRRMRMQNTHVRQKLNLVQDLAADACVKASVGHTFLFICG